MMGVDLKDFRGPRGVYILAVLEVLHFHDELHVGRVAVLFCGNNGVGAYKALGYGYTNCGTFLQLIYTLS